MSWFDLQIQEVWSRLGQNRVWFDAGTALRQPEGTSASSPTPPAPLWPQTQDFGHQLPSIQLPPAMFYDELARTLTWQKGEEEGQEEVGGSCQTSNWDAYNWLTLLTLLTLHTLLTLLTFLTLLTLHCLICLHWLTLDGIGWYCWHWLTFLALPTLLTLAYMAYIANTVLAYPFHILLWGLKVNSLSNEGPF